MERSEGVDPEGSDVDPHGPEVDPLLLPLGVEIEMGDAGDFKVLRILLILGRCYRTFFPLHHNS